MLQDFCRWLAHTPPSKAIQETSWAIPTVQTIHILAIAIVMSSIVMLDARLLGITARGQGLASVSRRYLPWLWSALPVLLLSGTVLIVAEPARELQSQVFWLKMSLLVCAVLLTIAYQHVLQAREGYWDVHRSQARMLAVISLLLWVAILSAGRWIAYVKHG